MPKVPRQTRILLEVKRLAGIRANLHRSLLYPARPSHILKGVLIENTPYKGKVYVWSVRLPLYVPLDSVVLTYSERLGGGAYFEGSAKEIAEAVHASILRSGETYEDIFETEMTVAEFSRRYVEWISWDEHSVAPRVFNAGATFALLGDYDRARFCLMRYQMMMAEQPERDHRREACAEYLKSISSGADAALGVARCVEARTRAAIGLEP
jgi:hypothetical protein